MSTAFTPAPPATQLTIVNEQHHFPKVTLIEPAPSGYIHIAAEVDHRPPFLPASKTKHDLIAKCKQWCAELEREAGVVAARVLKAFLIPPGRGNFLKRREGKVHIARFDLAVLIETESLAMAETIRRHPVYQAMKRAIEAAATYTHIITATNVRRINPVDHSRDGVFLFNTRASVLLAIIFHATGNIIANALPAVDVGVWGTIVPWTVALAVIVFAGPTQLGREAPPAIGEAESQPLAFRKRVDPDPDGFRRAKMIETL